ncbi:MAG: hypothetical protein R3308_02450, partial [Thiohalobacterales bacterium]|nr:hypothetical protein [Thiohalobacterales bacterium]
MADPGNKRRVSGHVIIWSLAALGVFGILTTLQRQLIYFPSVAPESVLLEEAARLGLGVWRD